MPKTKQQEAQEARLQRNTVQAKKSRADAKKNNRSASSKPSRKGGFFAGLKADAPQTAQQSIPYREMYRDGICRLTDNYYTKTVQFFDINYQLAQADDKAQIFEGYCDFLNYFDSSIHVQLTFINQRANMQDFAKTIDIPARGDEYDGIRTEYADMLKNQLQKGNNGLVKRKYITFGIEADNSYTFTSKNMIVDPVTFEFRKDIPVANDMLIWGRPGYQTMMTGASDPVSFYVKIKTETYGTAKIVKISEDGIVAGIPFNISGTDILGNEISKNVTTGENGQISEKLLPGTYLVTELPVDRYVTPSAQYVTIESGQTATVHFSNILKKFRVHVTKTDADTGTAQGDATLAGATYGIYNNGDLVDTYTTGPDGSFMTRYYVCGDNWTIREIEPSTGYLLNDTVYEVGADASLYEIELNTAENQVTETVIYGNIQLVKHTEDPDPDVSEDENTSEANEGIVESPEAGAVFT